MSTTIMDGTGQNYRAKVDGDNRLRTETLATPAIGIYSAKGLAGNIASGPQSVDATTTGSIFYFKNNSQTLSYVINRINLNWDQTTSVAKVTFWDNGTEPTANTDTAGAGFLNLAATGVFPASGFKWDGVGTGMTVADLGAPGGFLFGAAGNTSLNLESAVILPPGATQNVVVDVDEAGTILVAYQGYFADVSELA